MKTQLSFKLILFIFILAIFNSSCVDPTEDLSSVLACEIQHPCNNSEVEQGSELTILADASTEKGVIQRVEFFIDEKLIDSCCEAPFFIDYNTAALSPGKHILKTIAYHKKGNEVMDEIEVNIVPWTGSKYPVGDFETKVTRVNRTKAIQFTDLSQNVTGWEWTFGDGSSSTEQNPEKIYYSDGEFTVFLAVENENGKDLEIKARYVKVLNSDVIPGSFTDARDGKTYNTIALNGQEWMTDNLNLETENSCCYNDDPLFSEKLGRLYTWDEAMTACPDGWHLPSDEEWKALISYMDPSADLEGNWMNKTNAGSKMKKTSGWYNQGNGSDEFGFGAVPAGCKENDEYQMKDKAAYFWSSSQEDIYARFYRLSHDFDGLLRDNFYKNSSFSVRCVKD